MSIYAPLTHGPISGEFAVAPGAMITAEGQALVRTNTNQSAGVLPSTGDASDIFVGFALAHTVGAAFEEPFYNAIETYVVPTGGKVTLVNTPIAGQVGIMDMSLVPPAPVPVTGSVTVTGKVIAGLTAGNTVVVTYKYALTVYQRTALFGNSQPGGYVGNYVDQIGYISAGQVFTSEFDTSVNWLAATQVKLAANGQITDQTGTGVVIPNATITGVPSSQVPYLGIFLG